MLRPSPRLLLLLPTVTYRTVAFVEAARRLGAELTVASERPSTFERANPTGLIPLDFAGPTHAAGQARAFARGHLVHGVVAVDDDTAVVAAAIAEELGLRGNPVAAARAARDKHRQRQLLAAAGVAGPRVELLTIGADPESVPRRVPVRAETVAAVRIARRRPRRHAGRIRGGVRTHQEDPRGSGMRDAGCGRRRASRIPRPASRISVDPRRRVRARSRGRGGRARDAGRAARARDLRQARPAGRPVFRGNDLRYAVTPRAGGTAGNRRVRAGGRRRARTPGRTGPRRGSPQRPGGVAGRARRAGQPRAVRRGAAV